MHKLNVFIKEHGFWLETELLSMAINGDRCIVLAQDRVAIAWLVCENGAFIWTVFDKGLDLFDDPREHGSECWPKMSTECDRDADLPEVGCIKCMYDGSCQFQEKM